jgi:ceramide glucosyltransferase
LAAVNVVNTILGVFAVLSFALLTWQWIAARKFPLHQRTAITGFTPALTILKPLKGCDATTAASLESWFKQNYNGQTQLLFGVADADDAVCAVIEAIIDKYPHRDAQLVICPETYGTNAKVSTLIQLEQVAKHDFVLVSDADVRVPPDFLAGVVIPLKDGKTGLVNCFYRLANASTSAMHWEAIAANADFWSQVLQSRTLKPMDFALGAVMVTRRHILQEIGGFRSFANCLADDYQLGRRIAEKNYRIDLCPIVVECWDTPIRWRAAWKHQLRWARTIRVCQPAPYFFSILANAGFWPILWLVISATTARGLCFPLAAVTLLLLRIIFAQDLQRRLAPDRRSVSPFWMVPVKDLLQAAVWFCAFAGNTIEWRGEKLKLRKDGTLAK